MDGIVSAFKRLALPTNHARWSPAFSRLVQQLCLAELSGASSSNARRSSLPLHERVALLRKLDPYVKVPCFANTDENEILQAKRDLLALWEYLLGFVVLGHKPPVKELGYGMIVLLMQREEFTLRRLGFGPDSAGPRCSTPHIVLAKRYKSLLLRTFAMVMKSMMAKGKFAEIIHFSAQALVVFFFRLPLVGGRIIDALERKALAGDAAERSRKDRSGDKTSSGAGVVQEPGAEERDAEVTPEAPPKRLDELGTLERSYAGSGDDKSVSSFIVSNPDLFQWNYLNSEEEAEALGPSTLSDDNACLAWLSAKETFFLTFVEVYVVHVESVATRPVQWQVIPAYELILACFWPLLKSSMWWDGICKRKAGESRGWVSSLPAYMRVKRSALALLSNKALINQFIKLTYESTNLHSLLSVDSCVEHLNLWFSTVAYSGSAREGILNHNQNSRNTPPKQTIVNKAATQEERPSLPEAFDLDNYWFGIKNLLSSELFQVLLKVISLLYNTLHLFHGDVRTKFLNNLMHNFFFELFLHWSSEVRTFFQLTLVFKVLRADRRNLPCFTDAQVISEYGASETPPVAQRPLSQRRFSFGEPKGGSAARDDQYVAPAVYTGTRAVERRMAIFDETNTTDDEDLLLDVMFCSKIDAFVRMCLDKDPSIPPERCVYIDASLRQYASLLKSYYRGVSSDNLETLPLLAHRMVYTEFGTSE